MNKVLNIFKGPRKIEEFDWSKLTKKEKRRLNFLTKSIPYASQPDENLFDIIINYKPNKIIRIVIEVHKLYDKLDLTSGERKLHWHTNWVEHQSIKENYSKMPKPPKQDNKHIKVGSGQRSKFNTIRYPSKKRSKQTWNRFYKLFPHLK